MTSGATGSGPGSVAFSASANPNTSPRTGTITIAGQTFTVDQAAAACTYTLPADDHLVIAGGVIGRRSTAPRVRLDGVSNNTSWLTVTSGASGSGPGTVAFSASANPNTRRAPAR